VAVFVPPDFDVPRGLETSEFVLEPLGPEHNELDYDAWTSSMEHIAASCCGPLSEREVYMCGPRRMIQHFQQAFRTRGVPSSRIHYEYFNFR